MNDQDFQAKYDRLTALTLKVGEQQITDGGLAAERGQPQVVVCDPTDPVTPGLVHAYCGPAGDQQSTEEAQLFAAAPALLAAAMRACMTLSAHGKGERVKSVVEDLSQAVDLALAEVSFEEVEA